MYFGTRLSYSGATRVVRSTPPRSIPHKWSADAHTWLISHSSSDSSQKRNMIGSWIWSLTLFAASPSWLWLWLRSSNIASSKLYKYAGQFPIYAWYINFFRPVNNLRFVVEINRNYCLIVGLFGFVFLTDGRITPFFVSDDLACTILTFCLHFVWTRHAQLSIGQKRCW